MIHLDEQDAKDLLHDLYSKNIKYQEKIDAYFNPSLNDNIWEVIDKAKDSDIEKLFRILV